MPNRSNDPTTIVQSRHSGHRFAPIFRVSDTLRVLRALPINAQRIDSEFFRRKTLSFDRRSRDRGKMTATIPNEGLVV